jgi:biotin carboxyl carrier protein
MSRLVRVMPAPGSRLPGDEARDVDPAVVSVEQVGPGRTVVRTVDGRDVGALVGLDRPASPTRARTIEVVVDGWRFELEVEDSARADLRARATRTRAAGPGSGPFEVHAMIPGRVAAVAVAAGDRVTAGQTLLVVEAMKMQNELRAPRDGLVERILVGVGETIDLGDLLVVLA